MNLVKQTNLIDNNKMIEMIVKINFESHATKYQKIKQIKFKISFERFETFEKFKKLA